MSILSSANPGPTGIKMSEQKASGKPEAHEVTDPGIEPGIQP